MHTCDISMGCPQGLACGPGFWNILISTYMNSIFDIKLPICFADNCLVTIVNDDDGSI